MKKILLYSGVATVLLIASCKKDNDNHRYYSPNYNLTFWTASNCSPNPITVTVDSQTATMTEYYPNAPATCGSQGAANFSLAAGTYNFTATNIDTTWSGSVTVTASGCTLQQLYCATGYVTFWVDSAANTTVSVTVDNGTGHITTAFPTTTPPCGGGSNGLANFTLPPGTYNYTATTSTNVSYAGSVTVQKDSCKLVKIY